MRTLLLLAIVCAALPALDLDGAYRAWAQGRPQEALPVLAAAAAESQSWSTWCDYGLAAAACGDEGQAVAALLKAHLLAPDAQPPLIALAALGREAPASWVVALGPIAALTAGWLGGALALAAGLALGWALSGRKRRLATVVIASCCLLALAPGLIARWHDAGRLYVVNIRPSWLLDASGQPQRQLAAGTILALRRAEAWEGRWLVSTPGGARGAVPVSDCGPAPHD